MADLKAVQLAVLSAATRDVLTVVPTADWMAVLKVALTVCGWVARKAGLWAEN
jgi:hypothetical protein